jgi:hypothetical protein
MRKASLFVLLASCALVMLSGGSALQVPPSTTQKMSECAEKWLALLSPEQKEKARFYLGGPGQIDWHFIPKETRKGLQIREMSPEQRKAADQLLAACLSEAGYKKAVTIMDLEIFLKTVQGKKKETMPLRDPERYYFSIFGRPGPKAVWGLSIEGHHLSLNFVIAEDKLLTATPLALASNPAEVMTTYPEAPKTPKGTRILAAEETLAFSLVQSLTDEQKKKAIIAEKAPAELREAAKPQATVEAPAGIPFDDLNAAQQKSIKELVDVYVKNLPSDVAKARREEYEKEGWDTVHFAWAGATKPGIGHYYRIQGKTVLIEFVNVQPDAEGNLANHIHCVLRSLRGDFGVELPLK